LTETGPSLVEAAPWIQRFAGQTIVVKIGGDILARPSATRRVVDQLATMAKCGIRLVVVHGAGAQIDQACEAAGIPVEKVDGRRVTRPEVRDILAEVLGRLNRDFCRQLSEFGLHPFGLEDGATASVIATRRPPVEQDGRSIDFGEVGDIQTVSQGLWPPDSVVVLPSLATGADGNLLNVNADTVASRVAVEVGAIKVVFLTSVAGIMLSPDDPGPISWMSTERAALMLSDGTVTGGMKAKLQECLNARRGGVPEVHIVSGREPFTLLREVFTDEGCGTLISDEAPA